MLTAERSHVFVSYSRIDVEWLRRLQIHLRPLAREYPIDIWDDTRIQPGMKWEQEIEGALKSAVVAVLLVSADFLASEFITTNELPPLLDAARERGTKILPVIVSPSRFEKIQSLAQFQAVNNPTQPLVNLSRGEQELVFVRIAESIELAVKESKLELLEQKVKEQEIKVEKQQEIINQLVIFSMAFFLYRMLVDFNKCEREEMDKYIFRKTPTFENNLRWLRDHGYLEMTFQIGKLSDGQDIAKMVKLTPVGRYYIELRRTFEEENR